jgi:hypothetical protein
MEVCTSGVPALTVRPSTVLASGALAFAGAGLAGGLAGAVADVVEGGAGV